MEGEASVSLFLGGAPLTRRAGFARRFPAGVGRPLKGRYKHMDDGMGKRLHLLLLAAIAVGLIFCALTLTRAPGAAPKSPKDIRWNDGWRTAAGDLISLPYAPDAPDERLQIQKTLPAVLPDSALLVLSDDYLPVTAAIDGEPLPVSGVFLPGAFGITCAAPRVSALLPEDAAGKTLTLTFLNQGSKRRIELYGALLGSASAVNAYYTASDSQITLFSGLFFLAGVAILLLAVLLKRRGRDVYRAELTYAAEFILLSALWFLADSGDYALHYGRYGAYLFVNLFSYILLSSPLLMYLGGQKPVGARLIRRLAAAPPLFLFAVVLFALFGAFDLSLILTLSHAMYFIIIVCVLVCFAMTLLSMREKKQLAMFLGVALLALSSLATMISFYFSRSPDNTSWFRYGITIFAVLLIVRTLYAVLGGVVKARSVESLRRSANYDELTQLCNKRAFCTETEELFRKNPDQAFLLCCFDIDKFHLINDMFGHKTGDALLKHIAKTLMENMPYMATFGRLDTDRFAFCLPNAPRRAEVWTSMLRTKIGQFPLRHVITPSFGCYIAHPKENEPIETMIDRALLARGTVKGSLISSYAFYDAALYEQQVFEQHIVNRIDPAMENGQIYLVLQPKYSLKTRRLDGAEALVRWRDPELGLISPGRFIPVLEKNGLILRLDEFMWARACEVLNGWIKAFGAENALPVSVNVSRVHLYHSELAETLTRLVTRYGIPPRLLALEITESAFTDRPEALGRLVDELHQRGFSIHMDDFGSAYSSLNMLRDVDVDVLKLDMGFFAGEWNKERGAAILKAVISMARALNVNVVAEGVENAAQADMLCALGCRSAQGYFFSPPVTQQEMLELLSADSAEPVPKYLQM